MEENSKESEGDKKPIRNNYEESQKGQIEITNQPNSNQQVIDASIYSRLYSIEDAYRTQYYDTPSPTNKLGDRRDFGNFYDLVQERKERVMAFLQKDVLQINNPDLRPFVSLNHAYESLIPYHLFSSGLYEDQVFLNTDIKIDIKDVYAECLQSLVDVGDSCNKPFVEEHGLVCELLLFHEQRYLKVNQEAVAARKKVVLNKRNTLIRLRVEDRGCENGVRVANCRFYFSLPADCST